MNRAEGATPRRRLRIPRFALMMANGIRIFRISSAPWRKGLKMGTNLVTLSREKEEIEAMLPVEKKADWRRKKKNNATRASLVVRMR